MSNKAIKRLIIAGLVVVIAIVLLNVCTVQVPTGNTAIITTFGKVEDYTLEAGFHLKSGSAVADLPLKGINDLPVDLGYAFGNCIHKISSSLIYRMGIFISAAQSISRRMPSLTSGPQTHSS